MPKKYRHVLVPQHSSRGLQLLRQGMDLYSHARVNVHQWGCAYPLLFALAPPPPPPGQVPTKDLVLSFSFTLSVCSFQSIIDIFSFLLSSARPGTLFGEKASLICRIALDLFWTEKNVDLETCAPSAQLRSKGRLVVSSTCGKHQRGSTLVGPYRNPLPNRPRKATFLLVLLAFSKSRPTAGFRI